MKVKETTIRVVRTEGFTTEKRPIEAQLEVEATGTEYEVPLDAGKLANVSVMQLANIASRLSLASYSHTGRGDECSSDLSHEFCTSLTLRMAQTAEMADARYKEADEVLKRMSKEMEGLSSITTHMKLAMDYGLAISEVGHYTIPIALMFIRLAFVGQPYRQGRFRSCETHVRGMFPSPSPQWDAISVIFRNSQSCLSYTRLSRMSRWSAWITSDSTRMRGRFLPRPGFGTR